MTASCAGRLKQRPQLTQTGASRRPASGSAAKESPAMREAWVPSPGWEDPLEKGRAPHSSILAWRIPWLLAKSQTRLRDFRGQKWARKTANTCPRKSGAVRFGVPHCHRPVNNSMNGLLKASRIGNISYGTRMGFRFGHLYLPS